jgi:TonB-dependent SusC/RagA subfamily outer membrane receptor
MITVMLRLTSIQTTLSQLTCCGAAATALYGSRASNGVVMIVMKKVETERSWCNHIFKFNFRNC